MNGYRVLLTEELDTAYKNVADYFNMSMEQTLTAALQLYMEQLTLQGYPKTADDSKLRGQTRRR